MKNQALFSFKDKFKTLKCGLLQFLSGTLRVKTCVIHSVVKNFDYFLVLYFSVPNKATGRRLSDTETHENR